MRAMRPHAIYTRPLEAISTEIGIDILLRKSRIDVVNEIIALL